MLDDDGRICSLGVKSGGRAGAVVLLGRYVTRPALRFVARSACGKCLVPWRYSSCLALVCCGRGRLVDGDGRVSGGRTAGNSEYRHALESDIEPFKGLLLGCFSSALACR